MSVIAGGKVIEGAIGPYVSEGAPSNGTSEVQTLTLSGTGQAGDTFKLSFMGFITAAIAWSATNATLLANINAALDALPNVGNGEILAAAVSLTSGIGTISLTFSGDWGKMVVPNVGVANVTTGASLAAAVAETTPGVDATYRGAPKGAILTDVTNGKLYENTGTGTAPTWTVTGTQT